MKKQYIDKSALVAELEKRIAEGEKVAKELPSSAIMGLIQAYKNTLSFINTIEAKKVEEVDLEEEIGVAEPISETFHNANQFEVGASYRQG